MTRRIEPMVFCNPNRPRADEPYHYTACGLDNVWLSNGFKVKKIGGEEYVSVHGVEELHEIIALHVAVLRRQLTAQEIRFLRRYLVLTQEELADHLDLTRKTISAYETGAETIRRVTQVFLQLTVVSQIQQAIRASAEATTDNNVLKYQMGKIDKILDALTHLRPSTDSEDSKAVPSFIADAAIGNWGVSRDRIAA